MRLTGERPARRPARNASRPVPIGGDRARCPVIQTRRRSLMTEDSSQAACGRSVPDSPARCERLGQGPERGQRPAGDRPGEEAVDERARSPGRRGRKSWSMATRGAGRPVRLDPPGDVHPAGRAGDVDEPQPARSPARSRSATARSPAARARGPPISGRRATKSTTSAAVGAALDRPRAGVVGQQPLPALDVAGERGRRGRAARDVDGDRAVHRSAAERHAGASWREERGEVARVERAAGRNEIAHHETHRRTNGRCGRRPAARRTRTAAGRARNAWTSQDTRVLGRGTGGCIARS